MSSGGCGKPGHVTAGSDEGTQWCATCAAEVPKWAMDAAREIIETTNGASQQFRKGFKLANTCIAPFAEVIARHAREAGGMPIDAAKRTTTAPRPCGYFTRRIPTTDEFLRDIEQQQREWNERYSSLCASGVQSDAAEVERLILAAEAYLRVTWATHGETRTAKALRAAIRALKAQKAPLSRGVRELHALVRI